ncbi:Ail/Lom family outer membrane beta-barrel protein [Yersinia pestis]|uniref:Ail/Lom family outer membrane beta-barrel protein n=1 Tax=Yersinia pestis TaxID=632 RepID=UPI00005F67D7|nr:Ail/Lom family outer membrane beta-barrel protein [Yersinia pestis]ABX88011.1 Ail/Lom family protein [Yersinia pestis Angola]AJJ84886.1 attachment invasion locus protein [Yersinia pestis Angola]
MKWITTLAPLSLALSLGISVANAASDASNTVSFGYAQSTLKIDGEKIGKDNKGFNLKYRHELDSVLGIVASFTHTKQNYGMPGDSDGKRKVEYYSLMVGPSWRFNEFVSAYALIGATQGKSTHTKPRMVSNTVSKTSMGYGAGLQFNPVKHVAIDTAYEYAKIEDVKIGTWIVGGGYRF